MSIIEKAKAQLVEHYQKVIGEQYLPKLDEGNRKLVNEVQIHAMYIGHTTEPYDISMRVLNKMLENMSKYLNADEEYLSAECFGHVLVSIAEETGSAEDVILAQTVGAGWVGIGLTDWEEVVQASVLEAMSHVCVVRR